MSAMALSNSTLSGCRVSLVMGFSYFFLRKQEVLRRLSTAASKMELRTIDLEDSMYHLCPGDARRLHLNRNRLSGNRKHVGDGRRRVWRVKYRRPCDDPITPRPRCVADVAGRNPAIDLDRQRDPELLSFAHHMPHSLKR